MDMEKRRGEKIGNFRELKVYQCAVALQQDICTVTKGFPREERYSLTDQIRRSSRSVGANLAEAWQKRCYPAHFVSKLTDADGELAETQHWLDTALLSGYLSVEKHAGFDGQSKNIGRMLGSMIACHGKFCQG